MGFLMSLAHFQVANIIVLGGFFLGIFYFTAYDDGAVLREVIVDIENQIKQTDTEISKVQNEISQVKIFEQEVSNNKKVIKYFLNYIPATLTFTELSSLVNRQALSSGINIESKEDNKQLANQEDNPEYDTLNLKLKVSGSFSQLMFFLSKLTEQKRVLVINRIDLSLLAEEQQIISNIDILAYRYKGEVDSPNKEQTN